ncbi:agnoprotein [Miniopterus schreibersi polyomavirus 3]|nr:agnoprotein [Miniopterus schreibersi polyomavirus 3]
MFGVTPAKRFKMRAQRGESHKAAHIWIGICNLMRRVSKKDLIKQLLEMIELITVLIDEGPTLFACCASDTTDGVNTPLSEQEILEQIAKCQLFLTEVINLKTSKAEVVTAATAKTGNLADRPDGEGPLADRPAGLVNGARPDDVIMEEAGCPAKCGTCLNFMALGLTTSLLALDLKKEGSSFPLPHCGQTAFGARPGTTWPSQTH